MFLAQAYQNANDGDDVLRKATDGPGFIKGKVPINAPGPSIEDATADDWYVIPAPPKVFSIKEIANKYWKANFLESELEFGKECHKNGRLERDLEFRPLFEAAQYCFDCEHGTDEFEKLADALENIKNL